MIQLKCNQKVFIKDFYETKNSGWGIVIKSYSERVKYDGYKDFYTPNFIYKNFYDVKIKDEIITYPDYLLELWNEELVCGGGFFHTHNIKCYRGLLPHLRFEKENYKVSESGEHCRHIKVYKTQEMNKEEAMEKEKKFEIKNKEDVIVLKIVVKII